MLLSSRTSSKKQHDTETFNSSLFTVMIISLRTLINTTIFWFIVLFGFWLYTRYDSTPAKYLLYAIGWDNLGNISIVNEASQNKEAVDVLSNQLIAERLQNLEELCNKSIRVSIYGSDINTPSQPQLPIAQPITRNPETTTTIVATGINSLIPVTNTIRSN